MKFPLIPFCGLLLVTVGASNANLLTEVEDCLNGNYGPLEESVKFIDESIIRGIEFQISYYRIWERDDYHSDRCLSIMLSYNACEKGDLFESLMTHPERGINFHPQLTLNRLAIIQKNCIRYTQTIAALLRRAMVWNEQTIKSIFGEVMLVRPPWPFAHHGNSKLRGDGDLRMASLMAYYYDNSIPAIISEEGDGVYKRGASKHTIMGQDKNTSFVFPRIMNEVDISGVCNQSLEMIKVLFAGLSMAGMARINDNRVHFYSRGEIGIFVVNMASTPDGRSIAILIDRIWGTPPAKSQGRYAEVSVAIIGLTSVLRRVSREVVVNLLLETDLSTFDIAMGTLLTMYTPSPETFFTASWIFRE